MHQEPEHRENAGGGKHRAEGSGLSSLPPGAAWGSQDTPVSAGGPVGRGPADTRAPHAGARQPVPEADETVLGRGAWASQPRAGDCPEIGEGVSARPLAEGGQAHLELVEREGEEPRVLRRSEEPVAIPAAWDHPHLVSVLGQSDDRRETLLALVPGGSLPDLVLLRGALPVGEVVTLLVPLAQALAHLHAAGAAHGDVAPQNVMFGAHGEPQLVDPGLATALAGAPTAGGTRGFAPPEREVGRAGDVYGWGAVAWFALTGQAPPPERERTPLPLLNAEVHADTARLIEDCLQHDPSLRPAAADLAALLVAHQRPAPLDSSLAVTPAGAGHMVTERPREPRWRAWLGMRPPRRTPRASRGKVRLARRGSLPAARRTREAGRGISPAARGRRPLLLAVCTAVLLVAFGVTAATLRPWETLQRGAAAVSSSPADPAARAVAALPALDRARTQALRQRNPSALESVFVPDSAALRADRDTISSLISRGERFEGLGSRLEGLRAAEPGERLAGLAPGDVVVSGVAVTAGHSVVPAAAKESVRTGVGQGAALRGVSRTQSERRLVWVLRESAAGWRIVDVRGAGE